MFKSFCIEALLNHKKMPKYENHRDYWLFITCSKKIGRVCWQGFPCCPTLVEIANATAVACAFALFKPDCVLWEISEFILPTVKPLPIAMHWV